MWMYLGPYCTDRPFSEELGDVGINTRIRRVIAHGADLNPRASSTPLRKGVDNTRVSQSAFTFGSSCSFDFLMVFASARSVLCILAVRYGGGGGSPYLRM
jgi:hypothetical protein